MTGFTRIPKSNRQRSSATVGLAPGTVVFVGEHRSDPVKIEIFDYTATDLTEISDAPVSRCAQAPLPTGVTWVNVIGIHDVELVAVLGTMLDLHPLTQEDIVNTTQRPKAEQFAHYIYSALKMITFDEAAGRLAVEHIGVVLGEHFVVSFQEKPGDVFDPLRRRLRNAGSRVRSRQADYLAYALMDAVVDHYFVAIERIGDRIEDLDERILGDIPAGAMHEVHHLKREAMRLRKAVWPLREEIAALQKSESLLIRTETRVFLRDLYDHTIQVIDSIESFRDVLGGIHDIYLSRISNRMNEVMKVLTIISTIFIPLTFLAGLYGMNFRFMPELQWRAGYFVVLGVMLGVAVAMIVYFRRKKWI